MDNQPYNQDQNETTQPIPSPQSPEYIVQPPLGTTKAPDSKKSKIIALIIGGVVLAALIIGLILIVNQGNGDKASSEDSSEQAEDISYEATSKDYLEATKVVQSMESSYDVVYKKVYNDMPKMVFGYEAASDNSKAERMEADYKEYKASYDKLLSMPAMKDKAFHKEHKDFFDANDTFVDFMDGFFASKSDLQAADKACRATLSATYTQETALKYFDEEKKECLKVTDKLIKSKNVSIAKYWKSSKKLFNDLRNFHKRIQEAALAKDDEKLSAATRELLSLDPDKIVEPANEELLDDIDAINVTDKFKPFLQVLSDSAQNAK